jgi:SAM-dependent methyltransferase
MQFESLQFYRENAQRYSQLSHEFTHSAYKHTSHPNLNGDMDLLKRADELASGKRSLDAGCGAGARDVSLLHSWGYDAYGIDAVEENINLGKAEHPEIADKLSVGDLRKPLAFESGSFDLVLCNAVIQHLSPQDAETTAIPELARVLAPGGVLQLMFKVGSGVAAVSDSAFGTDGVDRSFQLYDEHRLLRLLEDCGCSMVEADQRGKLGGLLYFDDPKPMRYCIFWVRKK